MLYEICFVALPLKSCIEFKILQLNPFMEVIAPSMEEEKRDKGKEQS